MTFTVSQWFLELMFDRVHVDKVNLALGAEDFIVIIAPSCPGYEGIGLISIFTGLYPWVFKREFHFPQALLLFPIGIISVWVLNALRIHH